MQTNLCQTQLGVFCRLVSHLRPVISLLADTSFGLDCVSQASGRQPAGIGFRFRFFFFFFSFIRPETEATDVLKPSLSSSCHASCHLLTPPRPCGSINVSRGSGDKLINDAFLLEGDKGKLGKEQAIWEL